MHAHRGMTSTSRASKSGGSCTREKGARHEQDGAACAAEGAEVIWLAQRKPSASDGSICASGIDGRLLMERWQLRRSGAPS